MTIVAFANHQIRSSIQREKQGSGAMSLIVMGASLRLLKM